MGVVIGSGSGCLKKGCFLYLDIFRLSPLLGGIQNFCHYNLINFSIQPIKDVQINRHG